MKGLRIFLKHCLSLGLWPWGSFYACTSLLLCPDVLNTLCAVSDCRSVFVDVNAFSKPGGKMPLCSSINYIIWSEWGTIIKGQKFKLTPELINLASVFAFTETNSLESGWNTLFYNTCMQLNLMTVCSTWLSMNNLILFSNCAVSSW